VQTPNDDEAQVEAGDTSLLLAGEQYVNYIKRFELLSAFPFCPPMTS
jgi:hypothetical protein